MPPTPDPYAAPPRPARPATSREPLHALLTTLGACPAAVAWAAPYGTDYERAWSECANGEWMAWLAERAGLDAPLRVYAAWLVARDAGRDAVRAARAAQAAVGDALCWHAARNAGAAAEAAQRAELRRLVTVPDIEAGLRGTT